MPKDSVYTSKKHNFLNQFQSGFRPGYSTETQLAALVYQITDAMDKGKKVRAVFLDISKAFDRVSHKGLIQKLNSLGIKGRLLDWLTSYLTNRRQRVVIDGVFSPWFPVRAGVPQGSVMGPLLFLVYINDLASKLQCNIHIFADDTMIFEIGTKLRQISKKLERELDTVRKWGRDWLVKFSKEKTVAMCFGKDKTPPPIKFMGEPIETVFEHKHLGVILTNDLNWDQHVTYVVDKTEERLRYLLIARNLVSQAVLNNIYLTLIRPCMEYGCAVWSNLSVSSINKLQSIQNRAARLVTGALHFTSIPAFACRTRVALARKPSNLLSPDTLSKDSGKSGS